MMPQQAGPPFVSSAYSQPPTLLTSHAAAGNPPRMAFDPNMLPNPAMGRGQPAGFAKPPRHAAYNPGQPTNPMMMPNPGAGAPRPAAHFAPMVTVAGGQPPYQPPAAGPPRPHFTSAATSQPGAAPPAPAPAMVSNPSAVPNNNLSAAPASLASAASLAPKAEPVIKSEPTNGTRAAPTLNASSAGAVPGQRPKDGPSATEMTSVNVQRLKVEDALLYLDKVGEERHGAGNGGQGGYFSPDAWWCGSALMLGGVLG